MATGTVVLDFVYATEASVVITGQAAILAGSLVEAWVRPVATVDHTADEHLYAGVRVYAGNIVAGVGFTIYGIPAEQVITRKPVQGFSHRQAPLGKWFVGKYTIAWAWS